MSAPDESFADLDMLARQGRAKLLVLLVILAGVGAAVWWFKVRVTTEPAKVLIAVSVPDASGTQQHWWNDDTAANAIRTELTPGLEKLGLDVELPTDTERLDQLKTALAATTDEASLREAAAKAGYGTLIVGQVDEEQRVELEGANFDDYILSASLDVVDTETDARAAVPSTPLRMFLWGESPANAVSFNSRYAAERLLGPLSDALAHLPRLAAIGAIDESSANNTDKLAKVKLERLFSRSTNYREALAAYDADAKQEADEDDASPVAKGISRTRLSSTLGEEFVVGTVADGRAMVMNDVSLITVDPDALGYRIDEQSEQFELVAEDGTREQLFEHYNFFSFPAISRDGTTVAAVVANHGASKTLARVDVATGEFTPLLTHATDYYSTPSVSDDGSMIAFFVRPSRRSASALAVIDREGRTTRTLIESGPRITVPAWSHDGKRVYVALGDDERNASMRVVAVDVETGEQTHVIGVDPTTRELVDPFADDLAAPPDPDPALDEEGNPLPPDPATTSTFPRLALTADGTTLFVSEQALDGSHHLGIVTLGEDIVYERLVTAEVSRLEPHPTASRVAAEGWVNGAGRDAELFTVDRSGTLTLVTNDDQNDELAGWSRDGAAVFGLKRWKRPGDRGRAVRSYRYGLGG